MLGSNNLKNAITRNEEAYNDHHQAIDSQQTAIDKLNDAIQGGCASLQDSERLLSRFTNTPFELNTEVQQIRSKIAELCGVDAIVRESRTAAMTRSVTGAVTGTAAIVGTQIASKVIIAKSASVAATAAATKATATFAISSKLALAGAAGGAVGKFTLPALLGPVGLVAGAGIFGCTCYFTYRKNNKYADKADADTKRIKEITETVKERTLRAEQFTHEIDVLGDKVEILISDCSSCRHDYESLSEVDKCGLWSLLNHGNILSGMIRRATAEV